MAPSVPPTHGLGLRGGVREREGGGGTWLYHITIPYFRKPFFSTKYYIIFFIIFTSSCFNSCLFQLFLLSLSCLLHASAHPRALILPFAHAHFTPLPPRHAHTSHTPLSLPPRWDAFTSCTLTLQEHVQRSVPEIVERKRMLQGVGKKIQAACFDVEFALG